MEASEQGYTIAQAAKTLGVSPKTIRRHIKDGKIPHVLVQGKFGEEYRILDLPSIKVETLDTSEEEKSEVVKPEVEPSAQTAKQEGEPPAKEAPQANSNTDWAPDMISDLQKTNMQLAGQLGAAQARIRELESQLMLLNAAREPWWKKLFRLGRK